MNESEKKTVLKKQKLKEEENQLEHRLEEMNEQKKHQKQIQKEFLSNSKKIEKNVSIVCWLFRNQKIFYVKSMYLSPFFINYLVWLTKWLEKSTNISATKCF